MSTHDEIVTITAQPTGPQRSAPGPRTRTAGELCPDLEEFWPSRRGHAYDEFCR